MVKRALDYFADSALGGEGFPCLQPGDEEAECLWNRW